MLPPITPPVVQQFPGRPGYSWPALLAPLLDTLSDEVPQRQFEPLPACFVFGVASGGCRVAIEIARWPSPRPTLWGLPLFNVPVLSRLFIGCIEDRLRDFVSAHLLCLPKMFH